MRQAMIDAISELCTAPETNMLARRIRSCRVRFLTRHHMERPPRIPEKLEKSQASNLRHRPKWYKQNFAPQNRQMARFFA
jgi:hypothetical protein